ncbi:YigZ family protein [Kiloniella laminariae]|uniref:YigZ family protein n=1 Tax=Kiloniella laminariae TaxID=454162 RepID=A0ABT4LGA5_9PROT|nr:YigZ family protein [Kiloniella laminariae]MCZ4280123.1 YigZ family protein [Kiloniella laminariae]
MQVVEREFQGEIEEKKSRFLSYLLPEKNFALRLEELKEEHKKANHHVWAFRRLNGYGQVEEGSSDDGEPSGTSGPPSLRVLQGNDLINTAIITVRFFGGTKLGTGGLVRAYSESVKTVIAAARFMPYVELLKLELFIAFKDISHMEYLCAQQKIMILERKFGLEGADCLFEGTDEALRQLEQQFRIS